LSAQLWMTNNTRHAISDEERHAMETLIGRSRVDLSVVLGGVDLPAGTVAGLQEGDTFVLDARLGRPLHVVIGERTRFLALPGVVGSHMGIQIADVIEERPAAPTVVDFVSPEPTSEVDPTEEPEAAELQAS